MCPATQNRVSSLDELYEYALSFYGIPYQWGGEGPEAGFPIGNQRHGSFGYDCSGLVQVILSKVGADLPGDQTAHALYQYFKTNGTEGKQRGALAFFGTAERASHVGWMFDHKIMISAAGGGSWCTNPTIAKTRNAAVKIQPIEIYKAPPFLGAWSPHYVFA